MRRALAILLVCACSATGGTISGLYGTAQEWSWESMPFDDYTNCVLWLPFEWEWDASTNYLDASAYTNDGTQATANSRPTFVAASGVTNAHYDFDGTDDYITIPDDDSLEFGDGSTDSPLTITGWVKMDDATTFRFVNKTTSTATRTWICGMGGGDTLALVLYDNSSSVFIGRVSTPTMTPYEGSWVMLSATYDGGGTTGGITLYTNGVVAASAPTSGGSYTAMHNNGADVWVGGLQLDADSFADGAISDPRIYSKELSAAEVLDIYNDTSGAHP